MYYIYMESKINEIEINEKTTKIFKIVEMIIHQIDSINKKKSEINDIYIQYEFNKNLKLNLTTSYLKFQLGVLNNEKQYYSKLKLIFLNKFIEELYSISNFIILLIISMRDLDIGHNEEKKNIIRKILKVKKKKFNQIDIGKLSELVQIILNNMRLIKKFLDLFEKFIIDTENDNQRNNIHSKNFKVNLMSKKNHLELEYNKFCFQMKELIDYFYNFTVCIEKQLKKQEVLLFTLKKT
jgi:hypothetical protein